jgi:two-component system, sensor histidine kinase PdtaS
MNGMLSIVTMKPARRREIMQPRESPQQTVGRAAFSVISLLFLALTVVLVIWLASSYRATAQRGVERVAAASKIVAANATWVSLLARETLHRIDTSLGANVPEHNPGQVLDLNAAVADLPPQVAAYVLGADGETLFSNNEDISAISATDRDYFVRLRNGQDEAASTLLISRATGRQIFVIGERLERNGRFAGAAVVAFDASILRTVWDAVALGPNSTISLIRRDGQLVARHPEPKGPADMRNYVLFTDYMRKATAGIYRSTSPLDGENRLVGYEVIERTPYVAIASADTTVVMAPFWRDLKTAALVFLIALGGFVVALLWINRLARADARHVTELRGALAANKILMGEIHHRVKNNLQTVMALVRAQGFEREAVRQLNERILAMSAVHQQMYGFDQFAGIPARDFIPAFVTQLVGVYGRAISVAFEIDDVIVSPGKATPLALLLNELVTNSMKYAFEGRETGTISVSLHHGEQGVSKLTVSDDGRGFAAGAVNPGMGTKLINALVAQMRGQSDYRDADGTSFEARLSLSD